jgi:hypothetical protein
MSYYQSLKSNNLYRLLENPLKTGAIKIRQTDNKFYSDLKVAHDSPWCHTNNSYQISCYFWKTITFHEIVEKFLPPHARFVPIGCQDCYKVVVKPKTLKQLFALELLQKKMDHPSKCGIELRPEVFGNYGGYFYNRGIANGLICYQRVRHQVSNDPDLGPDVNVILKRACTEMEFACGPSDKWEITQAQIDFEMRLSQFFVNDVPVLTQTHDLKDSIRQRWIEHAYSVGDETCLEFNGGKPLYPDYVTYQHLLEPPKEKEEEENATETGRNSRGEGDCTGNDKPGAGSKKTGGKNGKAKGRKKG